MCLQKSERRIFIRRSPICDVVDLARCGRRAQGGVITVRPVAVSVPESSLCPGSKADILVNNPDHVFGIWRIRHGKRSVPFKVGISAGAIYNLPPSLIWVRGAEFTSLINRDGSTSI